MFSRVNLLKTRKVRIWSNFRENLQFRGISEISGKHEKSTIFHYKIHQIHTARLVFWCINFSIIFDISRNVRGAKIRKREKLNSHSSADFHAVRETQRFQKGPYSPLGGGEGLRF